MKPFIIDLSRLQRQYVLDVFTGYYVMAETVFGERAAIDIAFLTPESLVDWLSQYGDMNPFHINIIGILLKYPNPLIDTNLDEMQ
jgi:hypothetical protein